METHRIKIKIGDAEFEAEGKPELVKSQFEGFLAVVGHRPTVSVKPQEQVTPHTGKNASSGQVKRHGKIDEATLSRVFKMDDPLSLMATPDTDNPEADAILVLIYAHTEMNGNPDVTSGALLKSMAKTGLNVKRMSQTIEARRELIRSVGIKKGTRHSLNNRGIAESEKLIRAMVE